MGDDEQSRINTYHMCRSSLIDERIALYVEKSHVRLIPFRAPPPLPFPPSMPLVPHCGSPLAASKTADTNHL